MPKAPWQRARGVDAVLNQWRSDPSVRNTIALHERIAPREGDAVALPDDLSPALAAALRARGVERLFTHQERAYRAAREGRHTVVATPTASGKSLCYNLPVAQRLALEPGARALYLFPTRALARDQELNLRELLRAAKLPSAAVTYDGDTPADARRAARESANVIITNPDMLHAGILPHHANWSRLFASLRYVVIDEMHVYAGVFGAHVANVLRRLRRVARFHGADPVFLCASATVGNPEAHARRLLGLPVEGVTRSGAPAGPRHLVVVNPPLVNADLGIRASYTRTAVRVAADLVRAEVPTLVFGQSRNAVETMLRYLRDQLMPEGFPEESIQAYRGGYLATTRRRIEGDLRAGDVRCVVATSALELGIDVGDLDAVVCAGYPGTLAGMWQRFGRAGRRGAPSLNVLVASSAPIDQYLANEPRYLLGAPIEEARTDPNNVEVLLQHVQCATFELPFRQGDSFGDLGVDTTGDILGYLGDEGVLHQSAGRWSWVSSQYPAQNVSLRSAGRDTTLIVDAARGETLAEMDSRNATLLLHEHAIYQHEGATWHVDRVDASQRKAWVSATQSDHFTDPITHVDVTVLEETQRGSLYGVGEDACAFGEVSVVTRLVGYKKVRFHTHENLGYGELQAPPIEMQTTAFWFVLPEEVVEELAATPDDQGAPAGRPRVLDGLRGVAYAIRTVTCLALMCAHHDLDTTLGGRTGEDLPTRDGPVGPGTAPTVFLYDSSAGGVGLAERAFARREELASRALELVHACGCTDGCPACVLPGIDVGAVGRKHIALAIFKAMGVTLPV